MSLDREIFLISDSDGRGPSSSERYALIDLFNEENLERFLVDPDARVRKYGGIWAEIILLIYYYKWVNAGESRGFSPSQEMYEEFKRWNYGDVHYLLDDVKKGNTFHMGRNRQFFHFAYGGLNPMEGEKLIMEFSTPGIGSSLINFLPPLIREAYLETEDFCGKCMTVVANPEVSEMFYDLYFRFKLWGISVYDENRRIMGLDELCMNHMNKFCSEEDRKSALENRAERWFEKKDSSGRFPEEIRENIRSFL